MCGIVGYLGKQDAQEILLDCLGRLEYRGYDSAGIATVAEGKLCMQRCIGKNSDLQALLLNSPLPGQLGIAHTRWATHGRPSDANSHPHTDCSGAIAIVHNGIIENYRELKEELESKGHRFASDTDSEVIAHLVEENLGMGLLAAVTRALTFVIGSYAIAVICRHENNKIVVARSGGPPLVIGHREDGLFISSDITAILGYTRDIQTLEDDEIAEIYFGGTHITSLNGMPVNRPTIQVLWQQNAAELNGFPHFMLKEIHEQPDAVMNTIRGQVDPDTGNFAFPCAAFTQTTEFAETKRVLILACGSSWHAGLVGKHLIESLAGIPVDVDIASEYRYRPAIKSHGLLAIGISQSGETADTLGALKVARENGARILSLCNVLGSTMSRESDGVIYTYAGPEIGVAATKTFTCQLAALVVFATVLGQATGNLTAAAAKQMFLDLIQMPYQIQQILDQADRLRELADLFIGRNNALYLGRGLLFPLAEEGALKLKEISYIHAEAYPAGELKHGPIALIDCELPVVILAPRGQLYSKVLVAIQEVRARDGLVIVMASEDDRTIAAVADHVFYVPQAPEVLMPILMAVPLQLLAYQIAVQRECDVDKPRNLAKSVTVE